MTYAKDMCDDSSISFFFFDDDIRFYVCNSSSLRCQEPKALDLNNFYQVYEEERNKLTCQYGCTNQVLRRDNRHNTFSKVITLLNSFYCELNCPYCVWKTHKQNMKSIPLLNSSFIKNIPLFEKIIKNEDVQWITFDGFGEFYDNEALIKLANKYSSVYKKQISVMTNLVNYKSNIHVDGIAISIHKKAPLDIVFKNISDVLTRNIKYTFTLLLDNSVGFSINEAKFITKELLKISKERDVSIELRRVDSNNIAVLSPISNNDLNELYLELSSNPQLSIKHELDSKGDITKLKNKLGMIPTH